MTWTDWPARRSPRRAALAALVVAAAVAAVAASDPLLAALGAAMLLGATGEVLLPTRYAIGPEGIEVVTPLGRRLRPWRQLERWRPAGGDFAVEGSGPARILRRRRGLLLRGPGDSAAVADWLTAQLGTADGEIPP